MNIVIPMAGRGTRMRPHTLNTPKPLIKIAGKTIVERLVEEIHSVVNEQIDNIGFIIGDFGKEVENDLLNIALKFKSKGHIFYQNEALGTAHAVNCASDIITGPVIIAFADTLFDANFSITGEDDSVIWVNKVDDPSQFGVVKIKDDLVTDFIEKPKDFVSDLAIIGIYYFKDGDKLNEFNKKLIEDNRTVKGEFQLTDVLEDLKNSGTKFRTGTVDSWMDCGNVKATLKTNEEVLKIKRNKESLIDKSLKSNNSIVIEPCFIGRNVEISNSIIGPYVSISDNCNINNSIISNSVIGDSTLIENKLLKESFIGSNASIKGKFIEVDISDYSNLIS